MATSEYHHGEMDIQAQKATWDGFITGGVWGGLLLVLSIGYAVLAVAIGMNWMVALGLMAIVGFAAGPIPKIPLNLTLLKSCDIRGVFWGFQTTHGNRAVALCAHTEQAMIHP